MGIHCRWGCNCRKDDGKCDLRTGGKIQFVIRCLTSILARSHNETAFCWVQKVCLVGMGAAPEWERLIPKNPDPLHFSGKEGLQEKVCSLKIVGIGS